MSHASVNENSSLINHQVEAQERLEGCLFKLEALMRVVTLGEGIQQLPASVVHGYFSLAEDLIETAIKINQDSLGELLSNKVGKESPC
jgi:hypothetical protein